MPIIVAPNRDGISSISGEAETVTLEEAHRRLREREANAPFRSNPLVLHPDPPPAPPRPDPAQLRHALRQAHHARFYARGLAERAACADDRAAELVAQAEAALEGYAGLDDEIAEANAAAIRSGGDAVVLEIPRELAERLRARTEAEAKLADLGRARALLAGEAEAARAELANMEARVTAAATAVLLAEAEAIADRYEAAQAEAQAHLARLVGVAAVWSNGGPAKPGPLALSPRLQTLIANAGGPKHDARWHTLMKELRGDDADASFPEPT